MIVQIEDKFTKGKVFHKEECDSVEFKEINSKSPVNKISSHAEEYVLGFVNAQIEGDLYLGINDDGVIQGVWLNRVDRDKLLREIPNKLRESDPPVPPSCYKVFIHNVFDTNEKQIYDLHVVQVHVTQIVERHLYRTSGGSVYFKKGSSCIKLKSEEITKEAERRAQIHLQQAADELDKKLVQEPNHSDLLKDRAQVAKLMGDIETMDRMYKRLLSLNPKSSKMRIQYATAHKSIGDLEGALSILNDAIQQNAYDSLTFKDRGEMLLGLNRQNEALQAYKEALELNPDDYTIVTQIGVTLRQLGQCEESIRWLNYALSKVPSYRLAKYEKKKTYYEIFKGGMGRELP